MKKLIVLLGITICLLALSTNFVFAESSDVLIYDSLIYYKISDNNKVIITGVTDKTVSELDIPSEIDGITVTAIGDYAFKDLKELTTVEIPQTVTDIGKNIFYRCESLENVTLPSGLTKIPDGMFYQCSSLETIDIPMTVTEIGEYAFRECYAKVCSGECDGECSGKCVGKDIGLKEITLHEGIKKIGSCAFYGCKRLTDVTLPSSLTVIEESLFCDCSNLEKVKIPETVTEIEGMAFAACVKLKNISLPDSVETIGDGAFYNCKSQETFKIPENVTCINVGTFEQCTALVNIELPNGIETLENNCFSGCTALTTIKIPESVTYIGMNAFSGCTALKTIEIPGSVKEIANGAFLSCKNLTTITLNEGLEVIGERAFQGCKTLSYIKLPSTVKQIGNLAFGECENLTIFEFNKGLESIGSRAFYFCTKLESINIPSTVKEIGTDAFHSCYSVTKIIVQEGNEYFCLENDVLYDKGKTRIIICSKGATAEKYIMPETVVTADSTAFILCSNMKEVALSNNLTEISDRLFAVTNLEKIVIPQSVKSIGESAFRDCTSLTSIIIPDTVKTIGENAFNGCAKLADIYYLGKPSQWAKIVISAGNSNPASIHYNTLLINGIAVCTRSAIVKKGSSFNLVALNPGAKNVNWITSDENVATINESGVVTAVNGGTAKITAENENETILTVCEIVVSEDIEDTPMIKSLQTVYPYSYTIIGNENKEEKVASGVTFATAYDNYNGNILIEYGALITNKDLSENEFTLDHANVVRARGDTKQNSKGQYGILFYGDGIEYGKTYYTRTYAVYSNSEGGKKDVYGEIVNFIPKSEVEEVEE